MRARPQELPSFLVGMGRALESLSAADKAEHIPTTQPSSHVPNDQKTYSCSQMLNSEWTKPSSK